MARALGELRGCRQTTPRMRWVPSMVVCAGSLGIALAYGSGFLQAQVKVSDAQIEASVRKAFASAPELADESIATRTASGIVTLSGAVRTEKVRRRAELLAANAEGVRKVVDELQLAGQATAGSQPPDGEVAQTEPSPHGPLQSDGSYAPADAGTGEDSVAGTSAAKGPVRNDPEGDRELDRRAESNPGQPYPQDAAHPADTARSQDAGDSSAPSYPPPNGYPPRNGYPARNGYPPRPSDPDDPGAPYGRNAPRQVGQPPYPAYPPSPGYPRFPGYPRYPGYPPGPPPLSARADNGSYGYPAYQGEPRGSDGQLGGQAVVVSPGALLRVRINRLLSSELAQPGTTFDATIVSDVVAGGAVAIPRGATVLGKVVSVQSSGHLKGRGELSIALTEVTLGGKRYPLLSDLWSHHGGDKTIETVNKTAGFGAAGAVIGAIAGGGVGAAVGGGVGAVAGLGSSATSGRGQVVLASETVITFHLAQPTTVETVSQQELQRLAFGVGSGADSRDFPMLRRSPVIFAPGYYPGYYPYYAPYYYPGPYGRYRNLP